MMKLDYGTQISPMPIKLSSGNIQVGTLIKPTLRRIAELSFDRFSYYETLTKTTPEIFYTKISGDEGIKYWESLSDDEKNNMTLYSIVVNDERLIDSFVEVFNFFFEESVVFKGGFFILLKKGIDIDFENVTQDDICGIISESIFPEVLDVIQQICCIEDKEKQIKDIKFKNKTARKLYEKMQKAAREERARKKNDGTFSLPNVISAVSNRHPTLNPINIWDLTIFQLFDSFNRLQMNAIYDIDSTRVSVWGDKEKTFNAALWYKNEFDKK